MREQKAETVRAFCSGRSCSKLAGQHRLHPALIYKWRKEMRHQETRFSYTRIFLYEV